METMRERRGGLRRLATAEPEDEGGLFEAILDGAQPEARRRRTLLQPKKAEVIADMNDEQAFKRPLPTSYDAKFDSGLTREKVISVKVHLTHSTENS